MGTVFRTRIELIERLPVANRRSIQIIITMNCIDITNNFFIEFYQETAPLSPLALAVWSDSFQLSAQPGIQ